MLWYSLADRRDLGRRLLALLHTQIFHQPGPGPIGDVITPSDQDSALRFCHTCKSADCKIVPSVTSGHLLPQHVNNASVVWMGEHKHICSIVGKRAEESGSVDGLGVVAHGGIEDLGDLTSPVKITEVDGRAKDGGRGFSNRGVAL